jgi:hypothetical protein
MTKEKRRNESSKDNYEGKSGRLYAWSALLRSFSKLLWVFVILIVLVALGKIFLFKSARKEAPPKPIQKTVAPQVDWSQVNKEVETILRKARKEVEKDASVKLDQWIAQHMERVDKDFLEWYFGYWTQQQIGLKSLLYQVIHWVDGDQPTAAEKITQQVQEEFAARVLRPQIAQMEIERIINEVVSRYAELLRSDLRKIPQKYEIKRADWERYIGDIAVMVKNVDASRQTSLPLKALVGATAGGVVIMARSLQPIIARIGSRISARLSGKAAAGMATKTGGKVAARVGGKFLGTIIAVGIIIWDVWDHYQTKKKARPVLRQNIFDYFQEVKQAILYDGDFGLMTVIYGMEHSILENLPK